MSEVPYLLVAYKESIFGLEKGHRELIYTGKLDYIADVAILGTNKLVEIWCFGLNLSLLSGS